MNKFQFSKVINIWSFQLKNNKRIIIGWTIAVAAIMFMYMILFPSIQDVATVEMQAMPKELLQLFSMDNFSDMSNFVTYFGMVLGIIEIAIAIFAGTFGAGLLYKEEKTGSIEFLSTLHFSRTEIYLGKVLAAITALLVLGLATCLSSLAAGLINGGDTFNAAKVLKILMVSEVISIFTMSVGFFLSGVSGRIPNSIAGSGPVLICYIIGYLGQLLSDKGKLLRYLSPFQCFNSHSALAMENSTVIQIILYLAISLALIIAGNIVYCKRDYHI